MHTSNHPTPRWLPLLQLLVWLLLAPFAGSGGSLHAQPSSDAPAVHASAAHAAVHTSPSDNDTRTRLLFESDPVMLQAAPSGTSQHPSTQAGYSYALQLNARQLTTAFLPGDTLVIPMPFLADSEGETQSASVLDRTEARTEASAYRVVHVSSHVPGHHVLRAVNLSDTSERLLLSWSNDGLLGIIEHFNEHRTLLLHQAGQEHFSSDMAPAWHTSGSGDRTTTYIIQEVDSHSHPALECGTGPAEQFPSLHHSMHPGSEEGSGGWGSRKASAPRPTPLFSPFDLQASLAEQTTRYRQSGGHASGETDEPDQTAPWLHPRSAVQTTSTGLQGTAAEARVTLDLLIVYTEKARMWALNNATSIGDLINLMIARSQEALDNSHAGIELRVVRTWHTSFEEAGNASGEDLRKLTASPTFNPFGEEYDGYMEEVHTLRDEHGADLVSLLADITDVGGIAWQLNSLMGSARYGFSVNNVRQMTTTYTFVHELGHNLGSAHSRNQNQSPATIFGGLFEYSTGWRFRNILGVSYATVMTYEQGQSARIPHFSNPDIVFEGTATGSYDDEYAPADNARSLRYARHVVSNYRTSLEDPPEVFADDSPRQITAASGEPAEVTIALENTGQSNLHWTLDIGYRSDAVAGFLATEQIYSQPVSSASAQAGPALFPRFNEPMLSGPFSTPYLARNGDRVVSRNPSSGKQTLPLAQYTSTRSDSNLQADGEQSPATQAQSADAPELLSTSFTTEQGFTAGEHQILDGWMTLPKESNAFFTISQDNPATAGTQHLHLKRNPDTPASRFTGVELPWLGPLTSQGYSVEMDLHFNTTNVQFHVIADHSSAGLPVFELIYFQGSTFWRTPDGQFEGLSVPWLPGAYFTLKVVVEPWNDIMVVYHNGLQVYELPIYAGVAPELIRLAHLNGSGSYEIDIDNIRVAAHYPDDLPRFPLRKVSGAVPAGNHHDVQFSVDTADLPDGTYTFDAVLFTNDPLQPEQRIPVVVEVTDSPVSAESPEGPQKFTLMQNFPNPFNPTTTIAYELPEAADVQLEIFTITGQRVARLVNGHQSAGRHEVRFHAGSLASGMYLYRLQADGVSAVRPMMLVK